MKKYFFWPLAILVIIFGAVKAFDLVYANDAVTTSNNPVTTGTPPALQTASTTRTAVATSTNTIGTSSGSTINPMQSTGKLFSQASQRSYLIFPTLASGASTALDGFTMTTDNLGNNLSRITLTPKVNDYQIQTFVLTGSDRLYFFETSFGDDNSSQDYVYGDDYAVAVDSQGYILQ